MRTTSSTRNLQQKTSPGLVFCCKFRVGFAALLTALMLAGCGRPAPDDEAQAGGTDPAAQEAAPADDTVDASITADGSAETGSMGEADPATGAATADDQSTAASPILTSDNVVGVVDPTPGRAGVKVTSQNPIVAPTPTTAPQTMADGDPAAPGGVHVVQAGDTLSVIAQTYGVPMQSIIDANGLVDADQLKLGQELVIPAAG